MIILIDKIQINTKELDFIGVYGKYGTRVLITTKKNDVIKNYLIESLNNEINFAKHFLNLIKTARELDLDKLDLSKSIKVIL